MELCLVHIILFTYVILPTTAVITSFRLNPKHLSHRWMESVGSDMVYEGLSLAACVRKCQRLSNCWALNYQKDVATCEIITESSTIGTLTVASGWWFSNITVWPQEMAGVCASNPCVGKECVSSKAGPLCFEGCGQAPIFPNATTNTTGTFKPFGATVLYTCIGGTAASNASDMSLTCRGNGDWSQPEFQCA